MERERWQQIEELFHRVSALPPPEREPFLESLSDIDEALRREVASLLRSSEAEGEDPVTEVVQRTLNEVVFEGTEQQTFGPYRASRWLGGGSQSDVYLAERTDGEYRSKVAIKVAKRGFPTEGLRQRFRQERQILASLHHANIARILDGGTTEDGLPFFVMEYVDGEPIDAYCDGRALPIAGRLQLFLAVCSAVEHAHRNLTIHRDLKPGNILVAGDGRPILLDFGIAKLLDEPPSLDQAVRTIDGLRFLTPAYASPEQVLGKPLTTSTDVYSLGVVLYELLCGRPPYELEGLEPKALFESVCETSPLPPNRSLGASGRTAARDEEIAEARSETVHGLRQRLRGDLDTIVLKALRKEPERRYASVAALAEDLDRYLRHRPIRARKENLGYRGAKLLRRHPYAAATIGILLLAVALGVLSTLRATWLARAQRDQARISQAEAERVTDFLVGLFEVSSPEVSLGETVSALEILDRGADLIEEALDEQPLSRARLLQAMGRAYLGLGQSSKAKEVLGKAVADREGVLSPDHRQVAESLLHLSRALLDAGDYLAAEEAVERSRRIYLDGGAAEDRGRAAALSLLGEVRQHQGDMVQAEELFRRALEIRSSLLGGEDLESLESLKQLAEVLFSRQRLEEAGELLHRVLEGRRRLLADSHPDVVSTLNDIAVVQQASGDLTAAEATMRRVIEGRRHLYGEDHPDVALAYNNLGQILSFQGEHGEAGRWLEKALDLSLGLYPPEHPRIADLLYSLGLILEEQERFGEAEERLLDSLARRRRTLGEQHPAVGQSLVALASLHHRLGRREEALREARESFRILDASLPEGDYWRTSPMVQIGLLLSEEGRCLEALPFLEDAIALRRSFVPEGHPALAQALAAVARCRSWAGRSGLPGQDQQIRAQE